LEECAPDESINEYHEDPEEANHAERLEACDECGDVGLQHTESREEFEHAKHPQNHDEIHFCEADDKDDEVKRVPGTVEVAQRQESAQ
jgi:hypothetical protein